MKNRIFVLLGSNIEKEKNLPAAVGYLEEWCQVNAISDVYETCPVGLEDQPIFFNAAVLVESSMDAIQFRRDVLEKIEAKLKRVRTSDKNAPRTIDADLVLFNDDVFDLDADHHIPDPDLLQHLHVIVPVAELEPNYIHPEICKPLSIIARRLTKEVDERGGDKLKRRSDIVISTGKSP